MENFLQMEPPGKPGSTKPQTNPKQETTRMEQTAALSSKIAAAQAAYLASAENLKHLDAEAKTLRDRQTLFGADAVKTTESIPALQASLEELLVAVGLGKADFADVENINRQIADATTKLENLNSILASVDAAISSKDNERRDSRDIQLSCRRSYLFSIIDVILADMRLDLRLLFAAFRTAQGRHADFEKLMKMMVEVAGIGDLSDQQRILTERFGFSD